MRVYIGPYKHWISPYQIADAIFFWVDSTGFYAEEPKIYDRWDYKAAEKFGDWLSNSWVSDFCNWINRLNNRKIKVRIDEYDTWSMDHTLSLIIYPMLVQLKEKKHGSPYVKDEDVPENIRSSAANPKTDENDLDEYHHERWTWVLDQMIWSFNELSNDNPNEPVFDKVNNEGYQAYGVKMNNGFRLFGAYFQGLWD